jgi:hypothetical protein
MAVDALAGRLLRLLEDDSIVASAFSRSMRETLESLFWSGALREEKAGGGKRVVITDREALTTWIGARYPSGLQGPDADLPARATAVATFRDSKAGDELETRAVFMRGFRGAMLERSEGTLPLAALTESFRLAGVLIEWKNPWTLRGSMALVENLEVFLHIEQILPTIDVALWTRGRIDHRLLRWIASMRGLTVIHAGDYDPVGLDEYQRVAAAMPGRSRLFVPDDFEERLARFGTGDLLVKSSAVLERVRAEANDEVRPIVALMDRYGKALEQEALLVPMDDGGRD